MVQDCVVQRDIHLEKRQYSYNHTLTGNDKHFEKYFGALGAMVVGVLSGSNIYDLSLPNR